MIKYTSTKQLSIEEFKTPFYYGLDKNNRWVHLAHKIPWDEFAKIYAKTLREDFGRPALDARVVIGALIIKHKKGLSDEETIEEIKENPYLQFFLGYEEFSHKPPFDASLFVTLRDRLGIDVFEQLTQAILKGMKTVNDVEGSEEDKNQESDTPSSDEPVSQQHKRQGTLILDASVAPQDIKFPTDLDLLNESREHTERIIDVLWEPDSEKRKPRTYRKIARKDYLSVAKRRRKTSRVLRTAIRKQLNYVRRNIKTIKKLIGTELGKPVPLSHRDLKIFLIVQEIYRQQKEMYDARKNRISDRIVSVSQPYVRPIVRGKSAKHTEFGAKLSVSLVNGFVFLDHLRWDAFNESMDLKDQVEKYRKRFGCYPKEVIADTIYGTRENRKYLQKHSIAFSGKSLGRPPKLTDEERKLRQKELKAQNLLRILIEGKFGEGKRKYDLDCVKAKTMNTSSSWIAAVFFIMNIAHWQRVFSFLSFFKLRKYIKECLFVKSKWVFSY